MASVYGGIAVFKEHAHRVLNNASVVVKFACATVCCCYFLSYSKTAFGYLAVTPGYLIPPSFRIWTLFTGGLLEASILNVFIDVLVLVACGQQLEPLWGALEFLKFLVILNVGTAIFTSADMIVAYAVTKSTAMWFASFSGLSGVIGGVSVAFMQILPDYKIPLKGVEWRLQILPLCSLLVAVLLSVIRLVPAMQVLMVANGICIGWVYLRFYQPHGKGVCGDMSEEFEFASLFPKQARPVVRIMSSVVFSMLLKFGVCKSPVRTYDVGAPSSITISLPGSDPSDAERRRKKALRALNDRLSKQKKASLDQSEHWPTIEDEIDKIKAESHEADKEIESVESEDFPDGVVVIAHEKPAEEV